MFQDDPPDPEMQNRIAARNHPVMDDLFELRSDQSLVESYLQRAPRTERNLDGFNRRPAEGVIKAMRKFDILIESMCDVTLEGFQHQL